MLGAVSMFLRRTRMLLPSKSEGVLAIGLPQYASGFFARYSVSDIPLLRRKVTGNHRVVVSVVHAAPAKPQR
jgi:hypothetical protein